VEQFTDELRFVVVERDTEVAVGALQGAVLEVLVVPLRHVGVGHSTERWRPGRWTDLVEVDYTRRPALFKSPYLEQLQEKRNKVEHIGGHFHGDFTASFPAFSARYPATPICAILWDYGCARHWH